jgi:hypothetical protein
VEGVEATLLQRRRLGGLGLAVGLLGAVLQVILGVVDRGYFKNLKDLLQTLKSGKAGEVDGAVLIGLVGLVLLATGVAVYLLLRWTRVLQKESEEPFRYTVSIDPFTYIKAGAPKDFKLDGEEPLALLRYDLRERLNARIGRFSCWKTDALRHQVTAIPKGKRQTAAPDSRHRTFISPASTCCVKSEATAGLST